MKKYLFMMLAMVALVGCNGSKNGESGADGSGVSVKTTTIKGNHVYQTNDGYVTVEYDVQWPEEVSGIDADKFKAFVMQSVLDTTGVDMQAGIDALGEKFVKEFSEGGKLTTSVTVDQVNKMREEREDMNPVCPAMEIKCEIVDYDPVRNIIEVKYDRYLNSDSGVAAGILNEEGSTYYDCERNCAITLDDVLANKAAVLDKVKEKAREFADEMCIEVSNVDALTELPANFKFNDLHMTFTFAKYEIACGAAGNVEIVVPLEEMVANLSDLGKRMFLGNGEANEEVKNEVTAQVNKFISTCFKYGEGKGLDVDAVPGFRTSDYNDAEDKCYKKAGEDLWIDYDPWIDAQEFENVSFTVKNVFTLGNDKAVVELEVKNMENVTAKYLSMKRQDGAFKIDDFTTSGNTMRTFMEDYLNN